jgi:hypothetical protein
MYWKQKYLTLMTLTDSDKAKRVDYTLNICILTAVQKYHAKQ